MNNNINSIIIINSIILINKQRWLIGQTKSITNKLSWRHNKHKFFKHWQRGKAGIEFYDFTYRRTERISYDKEDTA